jgi:predicted phage terminase large subunit-like protein
MANSNLTPRQIAVMEQIASGNSLYEFLRNCWHIMEPGVDFVDNWHIEAICEHLEYVTAGLIQNLIVNIPPRHSKSDIVSVVWPCWAWSFLPSSKWIYTAFTSSLSTRDSVRCRRLVSSEWYRERYPHVTLSGDVNQKSRFETTAGGSRFSVGVGGALLGEGGDFLVADDPNNPKHIMSPKIRRGVIDWWNNVLSTRGNNPKTVSRVIIMQRLHQEDLCGELMLTQGKEWVHLRIPLEYEPEEKCLTMTGWTDPRTERGELLWKERYTEEWVARKKVELGQYDYSSMMQQRPTPMSGGMFKIDQIKTVSALDLPPGLAWKRYYDLAYSVRSTGHYTCTIACALGHDGVRYFRGGFMDKLETPDIQKLIKETMKREPLYLHGVESKLHGAAIVQLLMADPDLIAIPLLPVSVEADKITRAAPIATAMQQGKIAFVEDSPGDKLWISKFIEQLQFFPFGKYDDAVDAMSGASGMIAKESAGEYATQKMVAASASGGAGIGSILTGFDRRMQTSLPSAIGTKAIPQDVFRTRR